MSNRTVQIVPGEIYHVYNRGTDKRLIFLDAADYNRFIELLYLSNSVHSINVRDIKNHNTSVFTFDRGKELVAIGAYCLMPNHFHLMVTPLADEGVSIFMKKLCTSYSMYFNKRYERSGALFQGKFKSQHADTDEYLKYLFAYIHLNPIKLIDSTWRDEGIKDLTKSYNYVSHFHYSSLPDYLSSQRPEKVLLSKSEFPDYFSTCKDVEAELFEWLTHRTPS